MKQATREFGGTPDDEIRAAWQREGYDRPLPGMPNHLGTTLPLRHAADVLALLDILAQAGTDTGNDHRAWARQRRHELLSSLGLVESK